MTEEDGAPSSGVHGQLKPLFDVQVDGAAVVLVQSLKRSAHGIESNQAANEIVKVHVSVLITIATDDDLVELLVQRKACSLEGAWELIRADHAGMVRVVG